MGGAKLVDDVIIAQPTEGNCVAYSRGAVVSIFQENIARCPSSSATFSLEDGSRISVLAKTGPTPKKAEVQGGDVTAL